MRSIFQLREETEDVYRIVSSKHSNYAIDSDGNNLTIRDVRSGTIDSNASYLLFEITEGPSLSAVGRKTYDVNSHTFIDDIDWVDQYVVIENQRILLSSGTATPLTFYESPIDLTIPFDFNPDQVMRASNPEVTPIVKFDDSMPHPVADTARKVVAAYADQVSAMGINDDTTAAASAMLTTIEGSLSRQNANMRYPAEFYLTFREGMLGRSIQSDEATDSILGQLSVPYIYFTNETDTRGDYHPFMVIASYGMPDSLTLLWDVAHPPGDASSQGYASQAVTRSFHSESFLIKIPLRDYGEVATLTENIMQGDLATDVNETSFDHHNYSSISATGVAIDGVVIYPTYNNTLHFTQSFAEISAHGMHSGRGLGVHYHADAHSATHEGLNLYNQADYVGQNHPPIVSMGFDGIAGYGTYENGDTSSDGVNIELDDFGGHEHDHYAYHYHAFSKEDTTDSGNHYTVHTLPPQGAWAGRINDIPEFWQGTSPSYVEDDGTYLGTQ